MEQMRCVLRCTKIFEITSSPKLSETKTSMIFSKNVRFDAGNQISAISGFKVVESLGKYLGTMLAHERNKHA